MRFNVINFFFRKTGSYNLQPAGKGAVKWNKFINLAKRFLGISQKGVDIPAERYFPLYQNSNNGLKRTLSVSNLEVKNHNR